MVEAAKEASVDPDRLSFLGCLQVLRTRLPECPAEPSRCEEFFKALKTGCAFEERQLESFATLTNALALFFPIAWQMLLLRSLSRVRPDAPAKEALTSTQIKVLQHYQPQKMPTRGATVRDALYAVAGLGGHLKNNGPPGWRTLTHGMQSLVAMADAWDAGAANAAKSLR